MNIIRQDKNSFLQEEYTHDNYQQNISKSPFEYIKRLTYEQAGIGSNHVPVVIADLSLNEEISEGVVKGLDYHFDKNNEKWKRGDLSPDFLFFQFR